MHPQIFEDSCARAARTFGRKANLSVIFQGDEAYTDGSTIVLPALDQGKELTDDQVSITRGYVDHEAGHVIHSDMRAFEAIAKECRSSGDTLLQAFVNAIEDVRIEGKIIETYPGSKYNLDCTSEAVNRQFIDTVLPQHPEVVKNEAQVGPVGITWAGRKAMGYPSGTLDECLDALDPEVRKKVEAWTKAALQCRSTADAIDLARRLNTDTRQENNLPPPPAPGQGSSKPDDDDTNGQNNGSPNANGAGGSGGTPQPIDPSINIEKVLKAGKSTLPHPYTALTKEYDAVHTANPNMIHKGHRTACGVCKTLADRKLFGSYEVLKREMSSATAVMGRKLSIALQDLEKRDWRSGHIKGKLDAKRMIAAYNGDPNVHKLREDMKSINTAVALLIDHSGSMSGEPLHMAAQASIAMAEAIEGTGCTVDISGFTDSNHTSESRRLMNEAMTKGHKYGRLGPTDILIYKTFDQPMRAVRHSLGAMPGLAMGGTNDTEGILKTMSRLQARPEQRKIMVVLSDGQPGFLSSYGGSYCQTTLRNAIDFCEKQGIEMVGVGIGTDSVSQYYPKHVVLNNINDLQGRIVDILAQLLLGQKSVDRSKLLQVQKQSIKRR